MWVGVKQVQSPGEDVQRWARIRHGQTLDGVAPESRRRCGWGERSPGADVGGVSPVPALTWHDLQLQLNSARIGDFGFEVGSALLLRGQGRGASQSANRGAG